MEVLRDKAGRFIFVKVKVGDIGVTLATLYAPNDHQELFMSKAIKRLMEFTGHLILGGDLNILLVLEDTSSGMSSISFSSQNRIAQILNNQRIDIWRLLHPKKIKK